MSNRPDHIILYDGSCGICTRSVSFVLKHDQDGIFHFASLSSDVARDLLNNHGVLIPDRDTFYYLEMDRLYTESEGALRVARRLSRRWSWFGVFLIVPRSLRDPFYRFVARNRYRFRAPESSCRIPDVGERKRFLDLR